MIKITKITEDSFQVTLKEKFEDGMDVRAYLTLDQLVKLASEVQNVVGDAIKPRNE